MLGGTPVDWTDREREAYGAGLVAAADAKTRANGHDPDPLPQPLDWQALSERGEPPARDWALDYWIGMGHVTLLSGIGGIGKSILTQQIGSAIALGRPFISEVKQERRVLGWMGEDDERELWARQLAICRAFETPLDQMHGRLSLWALDRSECCLLDWFEGKPIRTSNLTLLAQQIGDTHAEVVILDNIGRLFGCNENDRHQVSSFFAALQWACSSTNAAVILIGHVAKAITGSGKEFSGSTAWENAARARLWFTDKPPDQDPAEHTDDAADTDQRFLAKRKVNYTARDLAVLKYADGAYTVMKPPSQGGLISAIERGNARRIAGASALRFKGMNVIVSDSPASPTNYLPAMILKYGLGEGCTKAELAGAVRDLMLEGKLRREVVGQYANRQPKYGLVYYDEPSA